jgi:hypothetical protein
VAQCRGKIALVARERDERHKNIAIRRVLPVRLLQQRQGLFRRPARVQRHGIDIGVAGIFGHQLVRAAQQVQCPGVIVLAYEVEAERVANIGIVGLDTERLIAPAGKRDQVLLQRIDAEGVADRIPL